MVESSPAGGIRLSSGEQRPSSRPGAIGHAFHHPRKSAVTLISGTITDHVNCPVRPNSHSQGAVGNTVIRCTVNTGAARAGSRYKVQVVDVAVRFQVIKL